MKQEKIEKIVGEAYLKFGQATACEVANKFNEVCYENCPACDSNMPTIIGKHECLICGQTTTPAASPVPETGDKDFEKEVDELEKELWKEPTGAPVSAIEGDKGEGWQRIVDFGASRIVDGKRNICSMFIESEEFARLIKESPAMYAAIKRQVEIHELHYPVLAKSGTDKEYEEMKAILNRVNNK